MVNKGGYARYFLNNILHRLFLVNCWWLSMALLLSVSLGGFFVFTHEEASADVLDVEILGNLQSSNNSGTTPSQRWLSTVTDQSVDFQITGSALANASVNLVGQKYGVLVIPAALANNVQPDGQAEIETSITVQLSEVALLATTLNAVADVVDLGTRITSGAIGSLAGVSINLTEVNQQLALLNALEDFGAASFTEDLVLTSDGRALYTNLDKGIGPILASELATILTNLKNAVGALHATGTGLGTIVAGLINTAIIPVNAALASAVDALLPALGVGGAAVQQLADAAVIGDTSIQMPTKVSGPGNSPTDLDAKFVGTVAKISVIDLSLLSTANGVSYIYFAGQNLNFATDLLPEKLNFGSHQIQTTLDETFIATDNGISTGPITTGVVSLRDTRTQTKNWQIKVRKAVDWSSQGTALNESSLNIYGGALTTDFPLASVTSISSGFVSLAQNEQHEVLAVENVTTTGSIALDLSKFELFVPKNIQKSIGNYEAKLVWTVTESP